MLDQATTTADSFASLALSVDAGATLNGNRPHQSRVSPRPGRSTGRSTRIRPVSSEPISLAAERLAAGQPIVEPGGKRSAYYTATKRLLDVLAAICLLILFFPFMVTTFIILMITTRGRPLFRQERLGYLGQPFQMYKFRTMSLDADRHRDQVENEKDGPIFKNRRDPRITRIGRFLRSSSIDEMPQLFNVLAGHMSLVGPRPPIGVEVAQYEAWQRQRLAVKPGLTCLWQVSGRSEIAFETWVRMDRWYLTNQSMATDLALLVKTPWTVITGRGAY